MAILESHPDSPFPIFFFILGVDRGNPSPAHTLGSKNTIPDELEAVVGEEITANHLGVGVDARVEAHSLNPPDHLCDLALVDGAELGLVGVKDLTGR